MGLADALITRLSNQRGVVVRPTSAVAKFCGLDEEPINLGRELDVELILEGNIQRASDRIRVTVQLVRVSSGVSIWAEKFDDHFIDIFAFEDAISERIADALSARMLVEDEVDWDQCAAA
jgi:eukaryotic-like serine/threonine-protein kinase